MGVLLPCAGGLPYAPAIAASAELLPYAASAGRCALLPCAARAGRCALLPCVTSGVLALLPVGVRLGVLPVERSSFQRPDDASGNRIGSSIPIIKRLSTEFCREISMGVVPPDGTGVS